MIRVVSVRHRLELDPFVWIDGRKFLKRPESLIFGRLVAVNRQQLGQLRAAIAPAGFAVNPHAVAQGKTAHDFGRDENVLRRLDKVSLGVSKETKTFTGNLDDAFAELRLTLFAVDFVWQLPILRQRFRASRISRGRGGIGRSPPLIIVG